MNRNTTQMKQFTSFLSKLPSDPATWSSRDVKRVGVVMSHPKIDVPRAFADHVRHVASTERDELVRRITKATTRQHLEKLQIELAEFKLWSPIRVHDDFVSLLDKKLDVVDEFQKALGKLTVDSEWSDYAELYDEYNDLFPAYEGFATFKAHVEKTFHQIVRGIEKLGDHDVFTARELQKKIALFKTFARGCEHVNDSRVNSVAECVTDSDLKVEFCHNVKRAKTT